MLKPHLVLAVCALLLAHPSAAATYDCASKETGIKLNDYDIAIGKREVAIAEMRTEIKEGGGSTEQQTKALRSFEAKLEEAKKARAELAKECPAKTEP